MIDTGRNWISLSWGKPDHNGAAPILAYRVDSWVKGGEARWLEMGITPINSFDAFNLKPNGEYQFRVTPRNRYGWGEPVVSDPITIGKHDELPEFTRILQGQLKALRGSEVFLDCEVSKGQSFTTCSLSQNKEELCKIESLIFGTTKIYHFQDVFTYLFVILTNSFQGERKSNPGHKLVQR